jgi:hypothetical protein
MKSDTNGRAPPAGALQNHGGFEAMETRTIIRSEAIDLLRKRCVTLVDEEHSLCEVAARLHILCGGFSQWTSRELKQRYDWIARQRPGITRKELESLANRWQLARQFVLDEPLACDAQARNPHSVCRGWDGFSEEDLARFVRELTGEEVAVRPDPAPNVTG